MLQQCSPTNPEYGWWNHEDCDPDICDTVTGVGTACYPEADYHPDSQCSSWEDDYCDDTLWCFCDEHGSDGFNIWWCLDCSISHVTCEMYAEGVGMCTDDECDEGDFRCCGTSMLQKCIDGQWEDWEECGESAAYPDVCGFDGSVYRCSSDSECFDGDDITGQTRCYFGTLQRCDSSNTWVNEGCGSWMCGYSSWTDTDGCEWWEAVCQPPY